MTSFLSYEVTGIRSAPQDDGPRVHFAEIGQYSRVASIPPITFKHGRNIFNGGEADSLSDISVLS